MPLPFAGKFMLHVTYIELHNLTETSNRITLFLTQPSWNGDTLNGVFTK